MLSQFKPNKMGNEFKLPNSDLKELSETQKASEAHMQQELNRISDHINLINNQIEYLEYTLKQSKRSIEYYKTIIADMTLQLHQIQMDQVTNQLTNENYAEKTKEYIESLKQFEEQYEIDAFNDYPENKISELEATLSIVGEEVAANENTIKDKMKNLLS